MYNFDSNKILYVDSGRDKDAHYHSFLIRENIKYDHASSLREARDNLNTHDYRLLVIGNLELPHIDTQSGYDLQSIGVNEGFGYDSKNGFKLIKEAKEKGLSTIVLNDKNDKNLKFLENELTNIGVDRVFTKPLGNPSGFTNAVRELGRD